MKKRLLSALLALALVFVLLPTTALAGETTGKDYDISINGKGYKFDSDGSNGYITAYYYGNSPSNYFFSTKADHQWTTNSNLMLTKEGNTVTITIRPSKYRPNESPEFNLKKESTSTEKNGVPCIEMGNDNNLVITGKGTLNITRNESKSYGAALYSDVGDITINGGITVNVSFLNGKDYYNKNVSSNAIYVGDNHNLTVSGSGTNVTATNQGFHSSPATVCVEGGTITVSGGASLSATNTYDDNRSGSDDVKIQHFNSYAISGTKSKPCTLIVADEKSSVTATTSDFTDIAESWAFKYTTIQAVGATIKAGSSVSNSTVTTIDNISGQRYAKISIPALQRTSDVLIAGENAVVGRQWINIPAATGTGSYSYDADKKELTLRDVNIASSSIINGIQFTKDGTYTINLVGTNTMSGFSTGISANSADQYVSNINITITGAGSLEVSTTSYAIAMNKGNLKFENTGEIKLTTSNPSKNRNVLSVSGNITITDMDKYSVTGITQTGSPNVTGDTVTLSKASHLKGYQNPDDTWTYLKSITIASKPSETYYNDKAMKYGETRIAGSGTISCDENGVITLNGATEGTLEFRSSADSTLVLEGTSTLSSIVTTQKDLTISVSGSGSLTVGSIKVHNQKNSSDDKPNLTINGATVTVGTAELNARAIDIDGDLTVTNGSLKATSTSDSVPTVQVGGNASFTGSTVTITNNSDRQGKSGEYSYEVSTGLYVGGTLDIKNAAKVTSTVIGGNAIYAKGDITISGDNTEVKATNDAYKFSAISTNKTVNISDNSTVKAENLKKHRGDPTGDTDPSTGKTYNPCPAIAGKIANKNSQNKLHIVGFITSSAGSQNPTEGTPLYLDIAPSSVEPYIHHYKVTITRGDEVARTQSPVVIAGTTLLNDTYYTITNGSKVAEGTDSSNYNAFYNSETKTLKLNNAKISTTTNNAAIKIGEDAFATYTITVTGTNELQGNYNHCIESYSSFKINGDGTLEMTNGSNTTASVIYCGPDKSLTIGAEVIFKNNSNSGVLLGMVEKDAYSFAEGYNVYASTNVSGSPLEAYDAAKGSTYKYLRVTKENLAPTTPTPQTPFTIYGIPAQFVDGGMIATTGVTATSSNNINLPIDRVEWYTFTPGFRPDGSMDSVINKTKATGNFEAGKYYVVEIRFVQDLSPFESWDMKVSGWSDNDVSRQSVTARNDIEIYFLTPASAATHEHNWAEKYDTVYHWKMCTYDGCTAISGKAPHEWTGWWVDDYRPEVHAQRCNCGYLGSTHSTLKYVAINGEQHQKQCPVDGCDYKIESSTTAHVYAEGSNICTDCGYNKSAPCDHGNRAYTNNGDGTHKVTCKACGATIVEKQSHEFGPTGACIYCGATQSGGDPTPDNPGTIVIIRPAEEEKPAQQPNPSTGANDLVGLAVAAAVAAALGSAALLRKHD